MAKQIVLLLCCAAFANAAFKPRDLADEAADQLKQLNFTIWGEIAVAHDNLAILKNEFSATTNMDYQAAVVNLQQERATISSQIDTIVDLAMSAGYDVSSCTNTHESGLESLVQQYREVLYNCLEEIHRQVNILVTDVTYRIDVTITKVEHLDDQLQKCKGDLLCIASIVSDIELYRISLIQDIDEEVQACESQVAALEVVLGTCSDNHFADFVAGITGILTDVTACVNRILG